MVDAPTEAFEKIVNSSVIETPINLWGLTPWELEEVFSRKKLPTSMLALG